MRTIGRVAWNAWAAVSLLALLALAGFGAKAYWTNQQADVDESGPDDVRFVINWANLSSARVDAVEHSHVSPRSLTGDHMDAYAIRISGVPPDAFPLEDGPTAVRWADGSAADATLREAIGLVASCASGERLDWFPRGDQLESARFLVTPWSVVVHLFRVTSAQLIFYDRQGGLLYYASCKT